MQNKFGCILFAELQGRDMIIPFFRLFWIPPRNPYLNQATQKNTSQIFLPHKILEAKISNPKILWSSTSLEFWSSSTPLVGVIGIRSHISVLTIKGSFPGSGVWHLQTADCRLQTADCMRQQDCKLNETKSIVIKVASSSTLPCSEKYM